MSKLEYLEELLARIRDKLDPAILIESDHPTSVLADELSEIYSYFSIRNGEV